MSTDGAMDWRGVKGTEEGFGWDGDLEEDLAHFESKGKEADESIDRSMGLLLPARKLLLQSPPTPPQPTPTSPKPRPPIYAWSIDPSNQRAQGHQHPHPTNPAPTTRTHRQPTLTRRFDLRDGCCPWPCSCSCLVGVVVVSVVDVGATAATLAAASPPSDAMASRGM